MQEQQEQRTSGGPSNPKQQIEQDSKVRKILRELNEDLQELEQLYNTEGGAAQQVHEGGAPVARWRSCGCSRRRSSRCARSAAGTSRV